MNPNDPMEDAIDKMAERLVGLGLATSYYFNEKTGATSVAWTESGFVFRDNFRRLLKSPTNLNQITDFEISAMLGIILFGRSL